MEGQVRGGVAQGIAAALYERVLYDEHGQLFLDLMERRGLMHADTLRAELAMVAQRRRGLI